jgi:hypothetical protein
METCAQLAAINIDLLHQVLTLIGSMDDAIFASSPQGLEPHRVGSHLRHALEFYDCFLAGLETSRIDYDARKHDEALEGSRHAAATRIAEIVARLAKTSALPNDRPLAVRMENADTDVYLPSSIGRELQALSGHTIHHFALIAVTLRLHGVDVDPDFGMSPSTLVFQAGKPKER